MPGANNSWKTPRTPIPRLILPQASTDPNPRVSSSQCVTFYGDLGLRATGSSLVATRIRKGCVRVAWNLVLARRCDSLKRSYTARKAPGEGMKYSTSLTPFTNYERHHAALLVPLASFCLLASSPTSFCSGWSFCASVPCKYLLITPRYYTGVASASAAGTASHSPVAYRAWDIITLSPLSRLAKQWELGFPAQWFGSSSATRGVALP